MEGLHLHYEILKRYEFKKVIGLDNLENNRGILRELFERKKKNEMGYRKSGGKNYLPSTSMAQRKARTQ